MWKISEKCPKKWQTSGKKKWKTSEKSDKKV